MAKATLSLRSASAIFKANGFDDEGNRKKFIAFAQQQAEDLIKSDLASPEYRTNPSPITSARLPGQIVFLFNNWSTVVTATVQDLQRRAPRNTGNYSKSYVVLVNQIPVTDLTNIPSGAEVIIFNRQPYTRKLETAHSKWRTAQYFNAAKNAFNNRFRGSFRAEVKFLSMPGGVAPGVPYILKSGGPLAAAKQNRMSSAFREGRTHLSRQKDRQAGQPISYPALVINAEK